MSAWAPSAGRPDRRHYTLRGGRRGPLIRETRDLPLSTWTPAEAAALPGPDWLRSRRTEAAERVLERGLPTEAEEVWRYSRIGELDLEAYRPAPDETTTRPAPVLPALVGSIGPTSALIVIDHGYLRTVEREPDPASQRLEVGPALAPDEDPVGQPGTDALTELNTAFGPGPVVLGVPGGVCIPHPVVVVQVVSTPGTAVLPHLVIRVGENAEATVVEILVSSDVVAWVDPVVELDLADAARLSYVGVQDLGPRVWQTAYQASRVGRDATLETTAVALGGDYARIRADSTLSGRGGTSHLGALYVGTGAQMHDVRTMQEHVAPNTTSDLLFKGAVSDVSRCVYSGLIRVRKGAAGTNAFQTNRNLVLSEGAHADSVPNLEIEENQLQCSHASATGPIDDEQRFYLESRGIAPAVAERLIVMGFFGEVLEAIPSPGLAGALRQGIIDKLGVVAP